MTDSPLLPFMDAQPARIQLDIDAPRSKPRAVVDGLLAGAAEVDITPPPGMPKAGHSRNAQDGTGFRTRLRARVIHLRSGTTSIAIVATDLHAGSAVLHRLIGQAIAESTDIPLEGLFLGATHTHAGPGQFHGCDFYNRFASNRPGFDPAYTHLVAERITRAVRQAHDSRAPSLIATGSTEVWGYTRNRSLSAHVCNDTVDDKRTEPQRKYAAINPWLHLLRVDMSAPAGGYEPLAALAVFSIHGTGISRHDPAYNADVWAYITGELAHRVERRTGVRPVAGAIEGTHGDMTPAVRPGMLVYPEAERVGRGIGEAAATLHAQLDGKLASDVHLRAGLLEIDLDSHPSFGGIRLPDPAVGAAKLAGAIENTTPLLDRLPPFKAGYPKPRVLARGDQGAKWVVASAPLQRMVTPISTFPRVLPIQLLIVGTTGLLGLPFEVTIEAGRRLEASLMSVLPDVVERAVVSSTANDYWDYLTTPEEYTRQCYEGASTLYGPMTHAFVTAAMDSLAKDLLQGKTISPGGLRSFRFHSKRYMPAATYRSVTIGGAAAPEFFEATPMEDSYWQYEWWDGAPGDRRWDEPVAKVEVLREQDGGWDAAVDEQGWPVDDQGWRLGVFHLGRDRAQADRHRYAVRWYDPALAPPQLHRFVINTAQQGWGLASTPFS